MQRMRIGGVTLSEVVVFASISCLGAAIDFSLCLALARFFGVSLSLGLLLAMLVSGTIVYLLHGAVTFRETAPAPSVRYGAAYLAHAALTYALRAGVLASAAAFGLTTSPGAEAALLFAIAASFLFNFTISRTLIFRARHHD